MAKRADLRREVDRLSDENARLKAMNAKLARIIHEMGKSRREASLKQPLHELQEMINEATGYDHRAIRLPFLLSDLPDLNDRVKRLEDLMSPKVRPSRFGPGSPTL